MNTVGNVPGVKLFITALLIASFHHKFEALAIVMAPGLRHHV